jgi:hypothetical protein
MILTPCRRHLKTCSIKCRDELKIKKSIERGNAKTVGNIGVISICKFCKKEIKNNTVTLKKFCSRKCMGKFQIAREIRACKVCGKEFEVILSSSKIYCSKTCAQQPRKNRIKKTCAWCGNVFERQVALVARSKNSFCCVECSNAYYIATDSIYGFTHLEAKIIASLLYYGIYDFIPESYFRRLTGLTKRRFIGDAWVISYNKVVEADGVWHNDRKVRDSERDKTIKESIGLDVIRFNVYDLRKKNYHTNVYNKIVEGGDHEEFI